ncbi:hypothetical protein [Undibacterium sp. Ren11W]|uniref:hypothetical protein n=1 Tax=Undibacterium sp. Ren11W TaxID=3413045 RepID=UPI003BF228F7
MRISNLISSILVFAVLTGCAHPIVISPNIEKIGINTSNQTINKNVAYYIADDVLAKAVITPGGGGDKVSYQPYRDIETGFYKMLSSVFPNVIKLKTLNDVAAISKNSVSYIISPVLVTDSSSPSPFTWPPTKFSAELSCNITDAVGNTVLKTTVRGEGAAEFDEFKTDFAMSGRRATEDALRKMQNALLSAPELRGQVSGIPANYGNALAPATTHAVTAAPTLEQSVVSSPAVSAPLVSSKAEVVPAIAPAQATIIVPVEAAVYSQSPMVASSTSNNNAMVQNVEFRVGASSVTVEKMAKQAGCVGGKGAGLMTPKGSVEVYRMACDNGSHFVAKCEMRQCSVM